MLKGLHTLKLYNCPDITDESVKMLGELYALELNNCPNITKKCKLQLQENGVSIT